VTGPQWVEFSPDGKRIAVCERHLNNGKIKIFGVNSGDSLLPTPIDVSGYYPINLSFNPQDENYYAVVETAPPASYRIALYRQGSRIQVSPPLSMPEMTGLDLAWSGDGKHLSVIYSHIYLRDTQGNISKYRIRLREWRLSAAGQVIQTGTVDKLIESQSPEQIHELLYQGTRRIFASSRGIFEVQSAGTIRRIIELGNENMDMDPQAQVSAVKQSHRLGLINLGPPVTQRWGQDIRIMKAVGIALSSDRKLIAVGGENKVLVFGTLGTAAFPLVREISDPLVYNIHFKPDAP
jgi:hypothetical protein